MKSGMYPPSEKTDKLAHAVNVLTIIVSITAIYTFYDGWKRQDELERREIKYIERDSTTTSEFLKQVKISQKSLELQEKSYSDYRVNDSLNRLYYAEEMYNNYLNRIKQDKKDSSLLEYYNLLANTANFEREYKLENERPAFVNSAHLDFDTTAVLNVNVLNMGGRPAYNLTVSILIIDIDSMEYLNYNEYVTSVQKIPQKVLYENGYNNIRYVFKKDFFERRKYILFLVDYFDYEFPNKELYHATFFRTYQNLQQVDFCVEEKEKRYIMDFVGKKNIKKFNYNDLQIHL